MRDNKITKLTLAGMFAALAFCCFSYLRIEVPMGLGLTGKIYIGHAFIILSALVVGAKYGALSGAIGLTLADVLAGYTTAAVGGSVVNVVTEPLIRFSFKYFVLGYARQVAYVSALNCAVSMALSAIPSVLVAVVLYKVLQRGALRNMGLES